MEIMVSVGLVVVAFVIIPFLFRLWESKEPREEVFDNRDQTMEIIEEVITKSHNRTLWMIAGELNPDFYEKIRGKLYDLVTNHRGKLESIAGPKILIKDEQYSRYVIDGKNRDEYWKAHPVIQLAYDFPSRVKLYLKKEAFGREETHCFCSNNPDAPSVTERGHREMEPSPVLVERNSLAGYIEMRSRFNEVIKRHQAELWKPFDKDADKMIRYISCSQMEEETKKTTSG